MRKLIGFIILYVMCIAAAAQPGSDKSSSKNTETNGYLIHATIKPYKNTWMYLGSYYGQNKILTDSAWFDDNSEGIFKGNKKLPGGIYFFVTPNHTLLFEILMDSLQHFSIVADSAHIENVTVTGSEENILFGEYTKYLSRIGPGLNALQQQLKTAKNASDSSEIKDQQKKLNSELNQYRQQIIDQHPGSMVAMFFKAVKLPDVKEMPVTENGKEDSLAAWRYMKDNFWNNVDFSDDRLVHTPFFDPKLNDYFKYYVSAEPDSIIPEVNYMLLSSRGGNDIHRYLLGKFTDKYINPEIMGQDKVFLFLFDNFFSKGDTLWLNEKQKKYIFDRAYSLIANQINEPAPPLILQDTSGKAVSLYDIQAPFTFIVFWDPTCSHCKEQLPRVDSMYEAKWKDMGVAILSVNTNENTLDDWKTFIKEHDITGWYQAWQTKEKRQADEASGQANYRQLYDIFQTPTMYLLDEDKHIIAKKLSLEQYDSIIEAKIKSKQKASSKN